MGKYSQLIQEKQFADQLAEADSRNMIAMAQELDRVATTYENSDGILDDIDRQFEEVTKLTKREKEFTFFAAALQCVRQAVLTPFPERLSDKEAADKVKKGKDEHSNRKHRYYHPSFEEIYTNPVPFDANWQTEITKGALKGGGKMGHRLTLGHDPVLGWIFGTANIATSTLTTWRLQSYHVKTDYRETRSGKRIALDRLMNKARTDKVIHYSKERFFNNGTDGIRDLFLCLSKEMEHLQSDVNTKNSLPFPTISMISPKLANTFAKHGIDQANINTVATQASFAEMINLIISALHCMTYYFDDLQGMLSEPQSLEEEQRQEKLICENLQLNQVKTKRIVLISNIIASSINIGSIALSKGALKEYLDVGGIAVTARRLLTDTQYIKSVEQDFITNHWKDIVLNSDLNMEEVSPCR